MNISEINPHIRYAKEQIRYANERKSRLLSKSFSMNYDCRIFYFITASGWLEINEEKYNLTNNMAIYIPPASKYRFFFNAESEYRAIVINFDFNQELSQLGESLRTVAEESFLPEKISSSPVPNEFSELIVRENIDGELIVRCAEEFLTKRYLYREFSSAALKAFLVELMRERNEMNSDLVKSVIDYVKLNYSDSELDNRSIAAHFGYHPYHISKLVRVATGKPLGRYILYYRIQMAKKELLATEISIEEVSWRCGFASTAYFIKIFHKLCGVTPKKYRDTKKYSLL